MQVVGKRSEIHAASAVEGATALPATPEVVSNLGLAELQVQLFQALPEAAGRQIAAGNAQRRQCARLASNPDELDFLGRVQRRRIGRRVVRCRHRQARPGLS